MYEADFIMERLGDGSALFHLRTGRAEEALRSSTYLSSGFFGGLLASSEPGYVAPMGRIRQSRQILWDILETDGHRRVLKSTDGLTG
jgi:hypothetical protein